MNETVDHPPHYTAHPSGVEAIDICEHLTFNVGNALKYVWRAGLKNPNRLEDLRKARWYLERERERLGRPTVGVFLQKLMAIAYELLGTERSSPVPEWRPFVERVVAVDETLLGAVLGALSVPGPESMRVDDMLGLVAREIAGLS